MANDCGCGGDPRCGCQAFARQLHGYHAIEISDALKRENILTQARKDGRQKKKGKREGLLAQAPKDDSGQKKKGKKQAKKKRKLSP